MEQETPEFFKLDSIDQEVLMWILAYTPQNIQSWIDYVSLQYRKRNAVVIDPEKMYMDIFNEPRVA